MAYREVSFGGTRTLPHDLAGRRRHSFGFPSMVSVICVGAAEIRSAGEILETLGSGEQDLSEIVDRYPFVPAGERIVERPPMDFIDR